MDALRFITCGSVDDGKSTLIGRLLLDTRAVLQDHLAGVTRQGHHGDPNDAGAKVDLALLTDGLSAEREQGITIDVAYRYFSTEQRKFIIGDAPGHQQYTRNMVTAASSAHAAVVLVDATKLQWTDPHLKLLPQTRRHTLLLHLLRMPSVVFAINKLDAVDDAGVAFVHIERALRAFAQEAGIQARAIIPVSALKGWNVVASANDAWCGYIGPSLLELLEQLPVTPADVTLPFAFPVQWVEKFSSSADTHQGRRVFWGRLASGQVKPGDSVRVFPGQQTAIVAQVLNPVRLPFKAQANQGAGVVLDREVDVSRGDWLITHEAGRLTETRELLATVAWLDDEPLVVGRVYWLLHGHRWVKAKVKQIHYRLNIHNLAQEVATQLEPNAIGQVELALQEPLAILPFAQSRGLGCCILVDTASHKTSGAVLLSKTP